MLAVVFSLLFAVYVLGPDLVSRLILGLVVTRRVVTLTRGEEISRAVIWCLASLLPALCWMYMWGTLQRLWQWESLKTCFAGIYSEQFFREHQGQWFHAANQVLWLNAAILWRAYVVLILITRILNIIIYNYASCRRRVESHPWLRKGLATFILPKVATWHVLFSGMLLPEKGLEIHVDILTKSNLMYQGRFAERQLGPDGSLVSITLAEPKRFQRERYLASQDRQDKLDELTKISAKTELATLSTSAKSPVRVTMSDGTLATKVDKKNPADSFWRSIPTNLFIVLGSEITSINLRYVPAKRELLKGKAIAEALEEVKKVLEELKNKAGM